MIAPDACAILQDLCDNDPLYLELLAKLLDTERAGRSISKPFYSRYGNFQVPKLAGAKP